MKSRNKRNFAGLILPFLVLSLLPTGSSFAAENSGSAPAPSVEFSNGGGSGVQFSGGTTPRVAGKQVPVCNKATGGGMFTDTDQYGNVEMHYKKYYAAPSNLCKGAGYTRKVIKCVIAEDVFRFYGTESNPFQGSSLTRVYNIDWCANDQNGVKDYLPNPVDAGPVVNGKPSTSTLPDAGTIYNPSESINLSPEYNSFKEPISKSDNCTTTNIIAPNADKLVAASGDSVTGGTVKCYLGVGSPRIKSGASCQSLQSTGESSIANAIKSNDSNGSKIRELIYSNYSAIFSMTGLKGKSITSRFPASYAAAVNNLPYNISTDKTTPRFTSADQITSMDNVDCSSIFDFIPVAPESGVKPESKMMGTCVVPVYLPARVEKEYASGNAVYDFWYPYSTQVEAVNIPRYLDVPMKVSSGATAMVSKFSTSLSTSQANAIYANKNSYEDRVPNSLVDLVYKDYAQGGAYVGDRGELGLTKQRTGGYFYPINTSDTKVPYAISPSTIELKYVKNPTGGAFSIDNMLTGPAFKAAKETKKPENVASSALTAATCYGVKLNPYLTTVEPTPSPTVTPTTSKTPTETSTPTPSPTPTNTKNVVDESIKNPGGDNNAPCSGPVCVRVTLQAPATFTVGGTSRIQTVKATNVQLICDGHTCDPSSSWDNSDPVISTPIGQLSVVGTGGFTACSSSLQKDCDLAIKSSTQPSSPITSASVSLGFYSPTRTSEAAKITLPAASVTITNKKLVCVVSHVVSYGPSFDDKGKMTAPGGSYTVCDREGWVPDSSTTHSLGSFELVFPAGQSASKPVSGTIGK